MSSVVDSLPYRLKSIFITVVGGQDDQLLESLRTQKEPTLQQRIAVERILSNEFSRNLGPDYEPTPRGRDIDNVLGAFLLRWPIEVDRDT